MVDAEKRKEAELRGKRDLIEDAVKAGKRQPGVDVLGVGVSVGLGRLTGGRES